MQRKAWLSVLLAVLYFGLVAFQPRPAVRQPPRLAHGAARSIQDAAQVTATAPAPTAAATPENVDTTQPLAAVALIWAVIISVVAVTLFLIWWTRPGRRTS